MNKKIKLISKILLVPYVISIFNSVPCLSMDNNMISNIGYNFGSTNANNYYLGYIFVPCVILIPSSLFLFSYLSDCEKRRVTDVIERTLKKWVKKEGYPIVTDNVHLSKPYLYNIINEIGNILLSDQKYMGEVENKFEYFIKVIFSVVEEVLCIFSTFIGYYSTKADKLELKHTYWVWFKKKNNNDINNLYFKNFGKWSYKFNNRNTELKVEEDERLQRHCKLIEENLVSIGYVVTSIFKDWKAKLSISYPSEEEFVIQVIKQ